MPQGSVNITQVFPNLYKDMASDCFSGSATCNASVFQLGVEKLRCDELVAAIRLGAPASTSELAVVDILADETQSVIDRCQVELARLQSLATTLEACRSHLRVYKTGILSMKSPIRRLPHDILGEIFKLVVCRNRTANRFVNCIGTHQLPTLALSQVCIKWYHIVVSTPALWSSFEFNFQKLKKPHMMIPVFLERSRLHKIDFRIQGPCYSGRQEFCADFLSTSWNSSRWHSVIVDGSLPELSQAIIQPLLSVGKSFPELSSLEILTVFGEEDFIQLPGSFLIDAPKLRTLVLYGLDVDLEFTQPCTLVQRTELRGMSFYHAFQILKSLPNVRDVILDLLGEEDMTLWQPLGLHYTTNLQVLMHTDASRAPGFISTLLDMITSPALVRFNLTSIGITEAPPFLLKSLSSMLTRSQASLTHLTLRRIPFTSREMKSLLHRLLQLTHLTYTEIDDRKGKFVNRLLSILAPGDIHDTQENPQDCSIELPLPNLHELTLLPIWGHKVEAIQNFLRLRRISSCFPLQKLSIKLSSIDRFKSLHVWDIEEQFSEFEKDGLNVCFYVSDNDHYEWHNY